MKGYVDQSIRKKRIYQNWIDANVPDSDCRGCCSRVSTAMAEAFPELRVVGECGIYGDGHAWCATRNNKIVDPTAHQFVREYNYPTEWLEKDDFPYGACPTCGELCIPDTPGARAWFGEDAIYGPHTWCIKYEETHPFEG
jgi:hypothetical protein